MFETPIKLHYSQTYCLLLLFVLSGSQLWLYVQVVFYLSIWNPDNFQIPDSFAYQCSNKR